MRSSSSWGWWVLVVVGACGGTSEPASTDQPDASTVDAGGGVDAAKPDASPSDAQVADVQATDSSPTPTVYNDVTDPKQWEVYDTTPVSSAARGPAGSVFDGKYMYFVPYNNNARGGVVERYDTTQPFSNAQSWTTFDLTTLNAGAKGFIGGSFDGKYVYFGQHHDGVAYGGRVARFDTTAGFTKAAAWDFFDASSVNPSSKGFIGSAFDGRYTYFIPYYNGTTYDGVITRLDTQSSFTAPSSWSSFDISSVIPNARGYLGSTFDGRYLYLAPHYNGAGYSGVVARFDTTGKLNDPLAWTGFDMTTVDGNARGYYGTVFDGRYVYFAPHYNNTLGYHGNAARLDTQAPFTDKAAWTTFDISTVATGAKGYIGAVFDGRYVTFVPYYNATTAHGIVARYDTLTNFIGAPSWRTFDLTTVAPTAKGFFAGGFDGEYLYTAEFYDGAGPNGLIARFHAKTPPSLPPSYRPSLSAGVASFF